MEKIILFLIVFGIGSLFEYLKKMREKRADLSRAAQPQRQRPVSFNGFTPFTRPEASLTSTSFPGVVPKTIPAENQAAATEPRQPVREERSGKASPKSFLPGETHQSFSDTEPLEVATPDEIASPVSGSEQQPAQIDEHYRRWRQAIIDSEILRPKFIEEMR